MEAAVNHVNTEWVCVCGGLPGDLYSLCLSFPYLVTSAGTDGSLSPLPVEAFRFECLSLSSADEDAVMTCPPARGGEREREREKEKERERERERERENIQNAETPVERDKERTERERDKKQTERDTEHLTVSISSNTKEEIISGRSGEILESRSKCRSTRCHRTMRRFLRRDSSSDFWYRERNAMKKADGVTTTGYPQSKFSIS
jgi:hypothetical protein